MAPVYLVAFFVCTQLLRRKLSPRLRDRLSSGLSNRSKRVPIKTSHIVEYRHAVLETQAAIAIARASLFLRKFDPKQPRVPRGNSNGGEWVEAGVRRGVRGVMSEVDCERQYAKDTFHCNMVGLAGCHAAARD
ncbi:MAG: hypothetical protein ABI414_13105, partial [Devosia sp.]